ncbi:MAG: hypothetical protein ACI9LX_004572, partial [Paraglaciecola sp.]
TCVNERALMNVRYLFALVCHGMGSIRSLEECVLTILFL